MSGDHLERVKAWLTRDTVNSPARDRLCASYETEPLNRSDIRALVAEVEQARTQQLVALGGVYATGWDDAIAAHRPPGWAEREAGWKRFLAATRADTDVDPEAYAKAKFAAEMERLHKADPGGAQWVEQILSERTGLPDRQAKLLAAIQREGGEWAPRRARAVLVQAGYDVTQERARQIMKQLAARGYLEPVRPRAYTYRLKTETPQNPEPDRSGT